MYNLKIEKSNNWSNNASSFKWVDGIGWFPGGVTCRSTLRCQKRTAKSFHQTTNWTLQKMGGTLQTWVNAGGTIVEFSRLFRIQWPLTLPHLCRDTTCTGYGQGQATRPTKIPWYQQNPQKGGGNYLFWIFESAEWLQGWWDTCEKEKVLKEAIPIPGSDSSTSRSAAFIARRHSCNAMRRISKSRQCNAMQCNAMQIPGALPHTILNLNQVV